MSSPSTTVQGQAVTFDKYGGPLKLSPLQLKALEENEILVRVHAASVNPIDFKRAAGMTKMFITDTLPNAKVCFDVAGVVVQSTSPKFKAGDRIVARSKESGTMADYCVVTEDVTVHLPEAVSFVDAAAVPLAGQTALQAFQLGGFKEGQSVLISGGAGGVGTYALQLAKHVFKASRVVTSCSGKKIDYCKSLGADECLDYTTSKYSSLQSGGKFDFIFDTVGTAQEMCSAKLIKPGGKIVSIASIPDSGIFTRAGMPSGVVLRGALHVLSTRLRWTASPGEYLGLFLRPNAKDLGDLVGYLEDGRLRSPIETVYQGLDKAPEAFDKLKQGRVQGKLVVCPVQAPPAVGEEEPSEVLQTA
ncbi:hypothetical protein BASA81_002585 [Batrachochytrium salamandrivorans]|nr:hypothetical protein BASA81_002585 [Batrachochytrium salamandrivorans]